MSWQLTLNETRVLGALFEKEVTTPEQYPLSLNGLTTACNQKSNREPVLSLDEQTVQATADELVKKNLISEAQSRGSRVVKYKHRFCNTEFGKLKFTDQELAIVCLLFLRGPQTPGELRTRSNRLCSFSDVAETESVLNQLSSREDGPFVLKLAREAGKRESRYVHLFSGEVDESAAQNTIANTGGDETFSSQQSVVDSVPADAVERIDALESEVADLKLQVGELTRLVDELINS